MTLELAVGDLVVAERDGQSLGRLVRALEERLVDQLRHETTASGARSNATRACVSSSGAGGMSRMNVRKPCSRYAAISADALVRADQIRAERAVVLERPEPVRVETRLF